MRKHRNVFIVVIFEVLIAFLSLCVLLCFFMVLLEIKGYFNE